jgi:hypothetical protein
MRNYFIFLIGLICTPLLLAAGSPRVAILPMNSLGLDAISTHTAETILQQEISRLSDYHFISQKDIRQLLGSDFCTDISCALEAGRALAADQVILTNLSILGEKIVVQYLSVDVAREKVLVGGTTSSPSVEALDTVMKRIARSIVTEKSLEGSAEVGTIIENEGGGLFRRRQARGYSGLSFGYLYPRVGYEGIDRSFTIDYRRGYETENSYVGLELAIRRGLAANIFANYLLTKTDFCPYIGGAFGFHWVSHATEYFYDAAGNQENKKRKDGFEITLNAGIRAYRTYNFQILLNFDYTYSFNDYRDQAGVLTLGLLW